MSAHALRADAVSFSFGNKPLFSGLSFAIQPGEIVGLIGPPDSGKTVLLKLLAGLFDADTGDISIDGESWRGKSESARYPLRRNIGLVFQNNALFDSLNVFDNVAFSLRAAVKYGQKISEEEIRQRVEARLEAVGLAHAAALFPHELSGGMKKRIGLARATVSRPRYCFYDEPTAGLDPVSAAKIYKLIGDFTANDGAAALIISNELDTLLPACHRVVMLYEGAIIYSGKPQGLRDAKHAAARQFATGASEGPL